MSQLINHYRVVLLKRSRNILDGNQSLHWHFSQTMELAEEATLCLYLLLEEAIAQDVPLTLPASQQVTSPALIEDLRQQCYELAEQLNRPELNLTQQVEITLELVERIAQLVGLYAKQAKRMNTLHRSTSLKHKVLSRKRR